MRLTKIKPWLQKNWWVGFILLHIVKTAAWFRWVDFSSALPLINFDYVQYYARIQRAHVFLARSGRFWGYDPFEGAGSISGPFLDVGTYLMSLVAHTFSPLIPIHLSVLIMEIAGFFVVPFVVYFSIRNFSGSKNQAWVGFALTVLLFGHFEAFSHRLVRVGLFGYMMASFVSIWQVSLMWKWCHQKDWRTWFKLVLVSSVLPQIHAAAILIVVVPCLIIVIRAVLRAFSFRNFCILAIGTGLVFLANWYWIRPYMAFSSWMSDAPYFISQGLPSFWKYFLPRNPDCLAYVSGLFFVVSISFAGRSLGEFHKKNRDLFWVLTIWLFWLGFLFGFGSFVPMLDAVQPSRSEFPFIMLIQVVAAFSLCEFIFKYKLGRSTLIGSGLCILLLTFTEVFGAPSLLKPLTTRLPEDQTEFVEYLKKNGPFEGRLLLECNDRFAPHFADLIPLLTHQILLGGPHPGNFIKTKFSQFKGTYIDARQRQLVRDPVAFNQLLGNINEDSFRSYLEMYNVWEVAAWSSRSIELLNSFSKTLELTDRVGQHNIYLVRSHSTWFFQGSGDLKVDYDQIQIHNASPTRIDLKFHWISTFRTSPPVPIQPILIKDDPLPFISLDNAAGHKEIVVTNAGL